MEFTWIGWNRENNSDKIWAVYPLDFTKPVVWFGGKKYMHITKYATVWGRRGKALQCNVVEGNPDKKIREKQIKGYKQVQFTDLDTVYPEFPEDLEKAAFWATLKG